MLINKEGSGINRFTIATLSFDSIYSSVCSGLRKPIYFDLLNKITLSYELYSKGLNSFSLYNSDYWLKNWIDT